MLATGLIFAGCGNQNQATTDTTTDSVVEEAENSTEEVITDDAAPVEESPVEKAEEDVEENNAEVEEETEAETDETAEETTDEEETATTTTDAADGNLVLHRAYPDEASRSFTNIVVATSGDKIVDVILDEFQYFDADTDYKGVPNSDKDFGEGAADGKILGSKIDNNEPYSADMKAAGGEITLLDNYNAITDFAKGKTIAELEEFLANTEFDEALDAITGATFKASPALLGHIVDAAKSDAFLTYGNAENPDAIELRYAIGAPHGEKSFGSAVVAMEGDKIIAASIDEYQYFEGSTSSQAESDFAQGFRDSKTVLISKLENNEIYSDLMAEKAGSTITLAESYKAIENFAAGKTIEELKEFLGSTDPADAVDAVTGATLVDTAGYLQLIVDAAENNIRVQ